MCCVVSNFKIVFPGLMLATFLAALDQTIGKTAKTLETRVIVCLTMFHSVDRIADHCPTIQCAQRVFVGWDGLPVDRQVGKTITLSVAQLKLGVCSRIAVTIIRPTKRYCWPQGTVDGSDWSVYSGIRALRRFSVICDVDHISRSARHRWRWNYSIGANNRVRYCAT